MISITCKNFIHISLDEKEKILNWRNSDRVRLKMNNQDIIPLENHLKYIDSLKNRKDCVYYLFYIDENPVGVFYLTDIDESKKSCMVGSYMGDMDRGGGFGIFLFYYNLYLAFEKYDMQEVFANVLKNNPRVYKIHKKFFNAIDKYENEKEWYILWNKNSWKKIKMDIPKQFRDLQNISVRWID